MSGDPGREVSEAISRFSGEVTRLIDRVFGADLSANEQVLALTLVFEGAEVTTREIERRSRLGRRAVNRLVVRLRTDGLVSETRSTGDGRAIAVAPTPAGAACARVFAEELDRYFASFSADAGAVVAGLGGHLDDQAPHAEIDPLALLRRLAFAGVQLADEEVALTPTFRLVGRQRSALERVAVLGPMQPSDLASSLGISRSATTYVIDQLCARGLLVRRADASSGDRRRMLIEATPEGELAADAIIRAYERQRESLIAVFSDVARWPTRTG